MCSQIRFAVAWCVLACASSLFIGILAPLARADCVDYRGEGVRLVEGAILPGAVARDADDRYLYARAGNTILILDLQGEEETLVSSLTLADAVRQLKRSGSYLYATTAVYLDHPGHYDDLRLHVIDISDPASPSILASIENFRINHADHCLTIANGFAYVGTFNLVPYYGGEIVIVDVTSPANPEVVGEIEGMEAFDLEVVANRLYAAGEVGQTYFYRGLQVYDVSQPSSPQLLGSVELPGYPRSVAVESEYAYVGAPGAPGATHVVRASPLGVPQIVGTFGPHSAWDLRIHDSKLLGGGSGFTFLADLDDPAAPVFLGGGPTPGNWLVVSGQSLYTGIGISHYDISDPTLTGPVSITLAGDVQDVVAEPPHAYVCATDQFLIYDVSNAGAPVLWGNVPRLVGASALVIGAGIAYVGDSDALRTIDISDPADPVVLADFEMGQATVDVDLWDHYAITCNSDGLRVIDVADVFNPVIVGFLALPGMTSIELAGSIVYGVDGESGLRIIDVSEPTSPLLVTTLAPPPGHDCVSVDNAGDLTCVLWDNQLEIFDSTNPAQLVPRASLAAAGWVVRIEGNFAYVTGVWTTDIVDLSNPDDPSGSGFLYAPAGHPVATASDGAFLYAAGQEDGFIISSLQCPIATAVHSHPGGAGLARNHPNPFTESTAIRYEVARAASLDLVIYDAAGRQVRVLSQGFLGAPGVHEAFWNGRDDQGSPVPSGTYFYQLRANGDAAGGRMILLRD